MRPMIDDPAGVPDHGLYDRLLPLERPPLAQRGPDGADVGREPDAPGERLPATAPAPGVAAVEVRYGLDAVANVWVAQFFDAVSGEFVRSVPATSVREQLAALRGLERGVDARA